jgi:hypothetical protein
MASGSHDGKIYIWDGLPLAGSEPKAVLAVSRPDRLSTDGTCAKLGKGACDRGRRRELLPARTNARWIVRPRASHAERKAPRARWQEHGTKKRGGARAVTTGEVEAQLLRECMPDESGIHLLAVLGGLSTM